MSTPAPTRPEDERTVTLRLTPREAAQAWNLLTMRAADERLPADYRRELTTVAAKIRDAERSDYLTRNPIPSDPYDPRY